MPTSSRQTARKAVSARIFADTGGWIALLSRDDANHAQAAAAWRRVGFAAAWTLLDRLQATPRLELVYADAVLEDDARALLQQCRDHDSSYADAVSFTAMKRESVTHAFGFDQHFLTAGFELIPSGRTPR